MRIAVVGTGVIGASWTTLFLRYGHEVVATDPAPDAEEHLRAAVAAHGAHQDRLEFTTDLAEAPRHADLVQENGPERVEAKHNIFAVLDAAAPAAVGLARRSSGLLPRE